MMIDFAQLKHGLDVVLIDRTMIPRDGRRGIGFLQTQSRLQTFGKLEYRFRVILQSKMI
jgi:hypothetical protein